METTMETTADTDLDTTLKALDRLVRHCRAGSRLKTTLADKLAMHTVITLLERARHAVRREYWTIEDAETLARTCAESHHTTKCQTDTDTTTSCAHCGAIL